MDPIHVQLWAVQHYRKIAIDRPISTFMPYVGIAGYQSVSIVNHNLPCRIAITVASDILSNVVLKAILPQRLVNYIA